MVQEYLVCLFGTWVNLTYQKTFRCKLVLFFNDIIYVHHVYASITETSVRVRFSKISIISYFIWKAISSMFVLSFFFLFSWNKRLRYVSFSSGCLLMYCILKLFWQDSGEIRSHLQSYKHLYSMIFPIRNNKIH